VFDNVQGPGLTGDLPTRFALADKMSRAWLAFARTGNPNCEAIPEWPRYSSAQRPTMIFDNKCRVENDPYGVEREAWSAR
jgi:para-nitrobenzyl esterase